MRDNMTIEQRAILNLLTNGYEKAGALERQLTRPVLRDLNALRNAGLVHRTGRGGVLWGLTPEGSKVNGSSPAAPVATGIDYEIVLEDLRHRRTQMDVAIAAIENLR